MSYCYDILSQSWKCVSSGGGTSTVPAQGTYILVNPGATTSQGGVAFDAMDVYGTVLFSADVYGGTCTVYSGGSVDMEWAYTVSGYYTVLSGGACVACSAGQDAVYEVAAGGELVGSCAGTATLQSGATVSDLCAYGGTVHVLSGATITYGGGLVMYTAENGGQLLVSSGAVADHAYLGYGGTMTCYSGSVISSAQIEDASLVLSGGVCAGVSVVNGGTITVYQASVTDWSLEDGYAAIHSGGTASNVYFGGGGSLDVSSGGVVSGGTIGYDGGTMTVYGGGVVNGLLIEEGYGSLTVSSGGAAYDVTVNGEVSITAEDGGTITYTE